MALPPGIVSKTVTVGVASFFDGTLAEGTATVTAPVNVVHTPTNRPIFSGQISKRFVNGQASFDLCPTDAEGLNRKDWTYVLRVVVQGALVQPEPIWFTLPEGGPDEIDLDGLVTVPSSAGTPVSVSVLTAEDLPDYIDAYLAENPGAGGGAPTGGAGGALSGTYPNPGLNVNAVEELVIESATVKGAFGQARPRGGKFIAAGDSNTSFGTSASQILDSIAAHIMLASGGRAWFPSHAGVGGDTSAQLLARIQADVIAKAPNWCHIMIGTNDARASVPLATYKANVQAIEIGRAHV